MRRRVVEKSGGEDAVEGGATFVSTLDRWQILNVIIFPSFGYVNCSMTEAA